jgi:hypothetical protein
MRVIVAQEFPGISVELIASRLDGRVQDCSGRAPEFGAVIVGLDFEFADGIHRRPDRVSRAIQEVDKVSLDFSQEAKERRACAVRTNLTERKEHSDVSGHTFPQMIPEKAKLSKSSPQPFAQRVGIQQRRAA